MSNYWPVKCTVERLRSYFKHRNGMGRVFLDKSKTIEELTVFYYMNTPLIDTENWKEYSESICDIELEWLETGKTTIFIPSDIAKWLSGCTVDFDDGLQSHLPFKWAHAITFENDLELFGAQMYPYLLANFASKLGPRYNDLVLLGYQSQSKNEIGYYSTKSNVLSKDRHSNIKKDDLCAYYRFIPALYAYISAFPDSLKLGPPNNYEEKVGLKQYTIHSPNDKRIIGDRGTLSAHWRRGHFRTLRDERFKRNEDGSMRVVFVHDCIVAQKDQEIYTVQD